MSEKVECHVAKLGFGTKAAKTANLLVGLRKASVAQQLKPFGLTALTLDAGWKLFVNVTDLRWEKALSKPTRKADVVTEADAFEGEWVPVIKIVLQAHYPQIADKLFAEIVRTEGKAAAISVHVLLERLEAMKTGESPFGEEGKQAYEYLQTRGLSDEIVSDAKNGISRLTSVQEEEVSVFDEVALQAAEAAMWGFYLEWSAIARHVIKDGNLLRELGFKKRSRVRTPKPLEIVVTAERAIEAPQLLALSAE